MTARNQEYIRTIPFNLSLHITNNILNNCLLKNIRKIKQYYPLILIFLYVIFEYPGRSIIRRGKNQVLLFIVAEIQDFGSMTCEAHNCGSNFGIISPDCTIQAPGDENVVHPNRFGNTGVTTFFSRGAPKAHHSTGDVPYGD